MIIILSPSKTLDLSHKNLDYIKSQPHFSIEAKGLMKELVKMKAPELKKKMKLSDGLAETVEGWHKGWNSKGDSHITGASMKGEAFKAFDFLNLSKEASERARNQMFILSGLYGALYPFDEIKPYRLEMAQSFNPFDETKSLNGFWSKRLPTFFNDIAGQTSSQHLINLASDEYNKVVIKPDLKLEVVNFSFKVETDKGLKNISVFAKQARGAMARFILEENITELEGIKKFSYQGYRYREDLSSPLLFCFTRTR